jgi:8-oxo-dGTP diphosphatase
MRTENVELTVLCLIHKDGEYLLQNRIKNDWKGFTLPGGIPPIDEHIRRLFQ